MNTIGLQIRNPYRCGYIEHMVYEPFINSKWLVDKRNGLRNKFYLYKIIRNGFIKFSIVGISILGAMSLVFYMVYILGAFTYAPYLAPWYGILIAEVGLITYFIKFYLDDIFPTTRCDAQIKYHR